MNEIQFILYVNNQKESTEFYSKLLGIKPSLYVKGMTEFKLFDTIKLGLMPNDGIVKILTPKLPNPNKGSGIPRCELYIKVKNVNEYILRAKKINTKIISDFKPRDWGDSVVYYSDLDGHIIAFAE